MKILIVLPILLALAAPSVSAKSKPKPQPKMDAAIEFLESAKKSDAPIPLMEKALHDLKHAAHDKNGHRKEAMPLVREAIAAAQAGDREKMRQKIDHAVATVHQGEAVAR